MSNSIVNLLEKIKHEQQVEISDFWDRNDVDGIQNWYNRFSNEKNVDDNKIVDLMYYLYIHENIEMYPVDHFQQTIKYSSEKYHFDKSLFLISCKAIEKSYSDKMIKERDRNRI